MAVFLVLTLTACGEPKAQPTPAVPPYPTLDPAQVALGRALYGQHCAVCHGPNAEGATKDWKIPDKEGHYPPPPHDDSGHTWHHSDRVLYELIRDGFADPLQPGSPKRMPAFGDQLSDAEIWAVIAYFKSLWSAENRQWQWEETLKDATPVPSQ